MKCVIFLNGEYNYSKEFINNLIDNNTICMCADGGANFAYMHNIVPLYIIGDLDSINKDILQFYNNKKVNIIKYNPEKDYTDFELILQKIEDIEKEKNEKFKEINIIGGLGNRIDLTLNNIFLMEKYKNISFLTENEKIFYKEASFLIKNKKGYNFSLISLDEKIEKLTLRGFKYELENFTIDRKNSRLVSNIIEKNCCEISFEKGKLIVILRK